MEWLKAKWDAIPVAERKLIIGVAAAALASGGVAVTGQGRDLGLQIDGALILTAILRWITDRLGAAS